MNGRIAHYFIYRNFWKDPGYLETAVPVVLSSVDKLALGYLLLEQ